MKQAREHLIRYLKQQEREFAKSANSLHHKPRGKNVHELRVTARRLHAILWILRKSAPHFKFRQLNRSLKKMTRVLGRARELDVAIKDAETYGLSTRKLKKQRKKFREQARKSLPVRKSKKLLRELAAVQQKLQLQPDFDPAQTVSTLRNLNFRTDDLHRVRISIKKIRYAREAIAKPVASLTRLQEALGRVHDLEILEKLAGKKKKITKDRDRQRQEAVGLLKTIRIQ